jgi:hypothetical protein
MTLPKQGEGQRLVLFLIVGPALLALIGFFVFVLLAGSTSTSKVVLDEQSKYGLYSNNVVRGLFSIPTLKYADPENASCTKADDYQRAAVLTLRFHTYQVPDSCTFFVNDRLLRTEGRLEPDCFVACEFEEFNRQFSLGTFDYRDDHSVRVCCNNICIEQELPGLCGSG